MEGLRYTCIMCDVFSTNIFLPCLTSFRCWRSWNLKHHIQVTLTNLFLLSNLKTACGWMRQCWWNSCCQRFVISSTHIVTATSTPLSCEPQPQPSSSLWAATTSMQSSVESQPGISSSSATFSYLHSTNDSRSMHAGYIVVLPLNRFLFTVR